jgi:hypothetical protein
VGRLSVYYLTLVETAWNLTILPPFPLERGARLMKWTLTNLIELVVKFFLKNAKNIFSAPLDFSGNTRKTAIFWHAKKFEK